MQKPEGNQGDITLPVAIGLAIGIGFLVILSYSVGNLPPIARAFERPSQFDEFTVPDQLAEVKLLKEKYPSDIAQEGFGHNQNENTIQFYYLVAKSVDVDGDGYGETFRQLELTLTYDESEGMLEENQNAKLLGMQIRCIEPAISIIRANDVVIDSAEDGEVVNFIQKSECIY
ncbi:MAG: hypothetical protein AB1351_12540 [Thermoproteota archaeon]